eukprot:1111125-Pyramimonas_sp.AAC.1
MRQAGHDLFQHLQYLWALGKLSAKDFSVACYHADKACVLGAPFGEYGMHPNCQSGKYQQRLDTLVPTHTGFEYLAMPLGKRKHDMKPFKVSFVYETLADEVRGSHELLTTFNRTDWPACYTPNKIACQPGGEG